MGFLQHLLLSLCILSWTASLSVGDPCNDGDIRLVNGADELRGRVEICLNDTWGTVCGRSFALTDANVACGQLGFSSADSVIYYNSFFGAGSGPVHLSDVACSGNEDRLVDCNYNEPYSSCTSHSNDVSVRCYPGVIPCSDGETIRLRGGSSDNSGRVEICHNDTWGTVCDDDWGNVDAQVACRQLGFHLEGAVGITSGFTNGDGQIWLDDVACSGAETNLTDCRSRPLGQNDCSHEEDAGVICRVCLDGDVRLRDGESSDRGRVEICNNNTWGTVCDPTWSTLEARAVCIQLGLPSSTAVAIPKSEVTDGKDTIWLRNVICTGTETRLTACRNDGYGGHNCSHTEDVGVICTGTNCTQGDIRLQGTRTSGRVEVCINNAWGTVCDDLWSSTDARVACRQLGLPFSSARVLYSYQVADGTGPIWLDNLGCSSTHLRLIDCPNPGFGVHNCRHRDDAGMRCTGTTCPQGAIRLQGGGSRTYGRVEICNGHSWGLVCNDFWDDVDAAVACRQLGSPYAAAVALTTGFVIPSGTVVWLDDVQCEGNETRLIDCPANPLGSHDCAYPDAAGVACAEEACTQGDIRLQGGTATSGRIEICNNNIWGTVCSDNNWRYYSQNPRTACRQLNLPSSTATVLSVAAGTGPIWLGNVRCSNTQSRLVDCSHRGFGSHGCYRRNDVGVRCTGTTCPQGEIRLQGGSTPSGKFYGRVEICNNHVWGVICNNLWDEVDAGVACRQLGLPSAAATVFPGTYTYNSEVVWLDNLRCVGNESSLIDCPASPLGTSSCGRRTGVAGVACSAANCTQGDVRLVGGNSTQGRVEICNYNIWGTVCDDLWDSIDARVTCRQLGVPSSTSTILSSLSTEDGSGPIWMDNTGCSGTESRLVDCSHPMLGVHNCDHGDDVGVICSGTTCPEGEIRLQEGPLVGRVEICSNHVWGEVCNNNWDAVDAGVACRELGLPSEAASILSYSISKPVFLDNVQCSGNESSLTDCLANSVGSTTSCRYRRAAGVACSATPCTSGDVRIQGGNDTSGRVEVCYNNIWGAVCSGFWDNIDAQVLCRHLGLPSTTASSLIFPEMENGTGHIWLNYVRCRGTELSFNSCPRNRVNSCSAPAFAGVSCSGTTCTEGDIRLVGSSNTTGRVEICRKNVWGTVCNSAWSSASSEVICRQLGLPTEAATTMTSGFSSGSGPIWLTYLRCSGNESQVADCNFIYEPSFCSHSQDIGVACPESTCLTGDIRLQGGNLTEGRLEICINNVWGTVCYDSWSSTDARVACRQLGFRNIVAAVVLTPDNVPDGTGLIWLDNVRCRGYESRLTNCFANRLGVHNCDHTQDVGVRCVIPTCPQGDVRLISNRVEICNNNIWGGVCDDMWDDLDARVVCLQLGLPSTAARARVGYSNTASQVWLEGVQCTGDELKLTDCQANSTILGRNCGSRNAAGVVCSGTSCQEGAIRLQRSDGDIAGRVEVCHSNVWGTVCNDGWDDLDAKVVCQQLGLQAKSSIAFTSPTQGTGIIWLSDIQCSGNELTLADCETATFGNNTCDHSQDAGLVCSATTCVQGSIRLKGGLTAMEGLVEICNNNVWGTVCDDNWHEEDAGVACRQLGFSGAGSTTYSPSQLGTGQIWLDNVECIGNESRLIDCPASVLGIHNCIHAEDVGVRCEEDNDDDDDDDMTPVQGCTDEERDISEVTIVASRSASNTALVAVSPSLELDDQGYFEYNVYSSNVGDANLDLLAEPVRTLQKSSEILVLDSLSTCKAYWVTTTAVTCGLRIRSEATFIDVHDPEQFTATMNLGSGARCGTWVATNLKIKLRDSQDFIMEALNDACDFSISCMANSTFTCLADDSTQVNFIATLVGTGVVSGAEQVQCLNEWALGVADNQEGRPVAVGGTTLTIVSGEDVAVNPAEASSSSGVGTWVWAVIIFAVAIAILAIAIVILIFSRKKIKQAANSRNINLNFSHPTYSDLKKTENDVEDEVDDLKIKDTS